MVGILLRRETSPLSLASKPGTLLSGYVRDSIEQSDVRDHAAEILKGMLTDKATKARSVGALQPKPDWAPTSSRVISRRWYRPA